MKCYSDAELSAIGVGSSHCWSLTCSRKYFLLQGVVGISLHTIIGETHTNLNGV